jgi:hypothetical protein
LFKQNDVGGGLTSGVASAADLMALIPKQALQKLSGTVGSGIDAYRRLQDKDFAGALTSAIGSAAPYAAPFLLGPEVGIPVGIATALGSPIANELKDYIQKHMQK